MEMQHGADVTTDPPKPDRSTAEFQQFLLWTLERLNIPFESAPTGCFTLSLDEQDRNAFSGAEQVVFRFDSPPDRLDDSVHQITPESPLWRWAVARLRNRGELLQASPSTQPTGVHSFAQQLFDRYTIEEGSVRLGGCTLEDEPLVRMTYAQNTAEGAKLTHAFADSNGLLLDPSLTNALQLADLTALQGRPRPLPAETIQRWEEATRQLPPLSPESPPLDFIGMTAVWCKYARGKLLFAIGKNEVELPFEGWAKLLADGLTVPPPFVCEATGRSSYHLATTDDGRITAFESIATCDKSGQRVLETELETCAVSGDRVLSKFLIDCPVTGARILPNQMVACNMCLQKVNPQCLAQGRCKACRERQAVGRDDALVARVLADYPKLASWRGWQISESASVHILTAVSLLRRLLLVLDKETFEPIRVADGSRLTRRWTDMTSEEKKGVLEE